MASAYDPETEDLAAEDLSVDDTGPAAPTSTAAGSGGARAVGAAPSGPLPPGGLEARIVNGRMYDPSGREVSSIGMSPEQAAAQFGAQLPMSQRELQQHAALVQGYGEVMRNPNLDRRTKAEMLSQMAREIHFNQFRLNQQRMREHMEGQQARGALQAENAGHLMAQGGMFSQQVAELQKQFPEHEIAWDQRHGFSVKPKAAAKPFDFHKANTEAEGQLKGEQPELFDKLTPDDFAEKLSPDEQEAWHNKYGKEPGVAEKAWANRANTMRERAKNAAVQNRVGQLQQQHGGQKPSAGSPNQAAQDPAGGSGGVGAAPSVPKIRANIDAQHKSLLADVENVQHPADREKLKAMVARLAQLGHQYAGQRLPPEAAQEVQRLRDAVKERLSVPNAAPARTFDRQRAEEDANRYAGGT